MARSSASPHVRSPSLSSTLPALALALALSLLLPAVALAAVPDGAAAAVQPAADCEELGFTGLGLCSDCDQLASYVKDAQLAEECRQCCVKDEGEAGGAKFTEAVLGVCSRRITPFPDVLSFIEDKAPKFKALKVVYRSGAAPKLIMKDSNSGEQEVVRIDNWKTENVEQFLAEKLLAPSG